LSGVLADAAICADELVGKPIPGGAMIWLQTAVSRRITRGAKRKVCAKKLARGEPIFTHNLHGPVGHIVRSTQPPSRHRYGKHDERGVTGYPGAGISLRWPS
jgi:hypothetical protein